MDDYICGFCNHNGKSCSNCRIAVICEDLEVLAAKSRWEHRVKYGQDNDSDIRCCEYCKHLLIDAPAYTLYIDNKKVWCALDDSDDPVEDSINGCERWERMPFGGFG